jgi:serine/threonine-protein kinase RsbW
MNGEIQLPCLREAFYRRERRTVPAAREFAAQTLLGWRTTDRLEDVLLCVSELATNALLHGVPPGRGYRVRLHLELGGLLRVEVDDSGAGLPHVREAETGTEDESGRGLLLVSALADKWGVADRAPGKTVWCEFLMSRDAPDDPAQELSPPAPRAPSFSRLAWP